MQNNEANSIILESYKNQLTTFSNNLLINYIATYDIFETVKLEDLDTVLPGCVRVEVLSFHKLQSGRFSEWKY